MPPPRVTTTLLGPQFWLWHSPRLGVLRSKMGPPPAETPPPCTVQPARSYLSAAPTPTTELHACSPPQNPRHLDRQIVAQRACQALHRLWFTPLGCSPAPLAGVPCLQLSRVPEHQSCAMQSQASSAPPSPKSQHWQAVHSTAAKTRCAPGWNADQSGPQTPAQ